jgi:hypothetical protein
MVAEHGGDGGVRIGRDVFAVVSFAAGKEQGRGQRGEEVKVFHVFGRLSSGVPECQSQGAMYKTLSNPYVKTHTHLSLYLYSVKQTSP